MHVAYKHTALFLRPGNVPSLYTKAVLLLLHLLVITFQKSLRLC